MLIRFDSCQEYHMGMLRVFGAFYSQQNSSCFLSSESIRVISAIWVSNFLALYSTGHQRFREMYKFIR